MKRLKLLSALLVAFLLFAPVAQAQDDEFREALREMNQDCPMDMGDGFTLTNFDFDGTNFIINIRYDDDAQGETMQALKDNPSLIKEGMLAAMVAEPEMAEVIEGLQEKGMGLTINIKGKNSRKSASFSFTARELEKALKSAPKSSSKTNGISSDELESAVKEINVQCPMSLGLGITLQSVQIEDYAVVYICVVDEDIVSMDQIEASRDAIQSGLEEYMAEASQDINVQQYVKCYKSVEKDVIFRYIGSSSGKVADFFIEL